MNNTHERILLWAQTRGTAFTSADAYGALDFVSDAKEMSDRIRQLFTFGYLARKKIDKLRFSYICPEFAPPDFDKCNASEKAPSPPPVTATSPDSSELTLPPEKPKEKEIEIKKEKEIPVSALDIQEGGSHYKDMPIQPVEFIHKNNIGYIGGNVIKHISRHSKKGGINDLKKARHYIDLLIELEGRRTNPEP